MRCLWPPSCTLAGIRQQISCRTWTTHHELRAAAFSFGTLHVTRPAVLQVVWMSNWLERASTFFPEPLTFLQQGPDLWVVSIGAAATHTINLSGIVVPAANTYRESFCKCHQTKSWFTCSFHLLKNIKQLAVLFRGWASASPFQRAGILALWRCTAEMLCGFSPQIPCLLQNLHVAAEPLLLTVWTIAR